MQHKYYLKNSRQLLLLDTYQMMALTSIGSYSVIHNHAHSNLTADYNTIVYGEDAYWDSYKQWNSHGTH